MVLIGAWNTSTCVVFAQKGEPPRLEAGQDFMKQKHKNEEDHSTNSIHYEMLKQRN